MLGSVRRTSKVLWAARTLDVPFLEISDLKQTSKLIYSLNSIFTFSEKRNMSARSEAADAWSSMREGFTSILADIDSQSGIATITINRPESLNALNATVSGFRFLLWFTNRVSGHPPLKVS